MKYYVITSGEDGIYIRECNGEELLKKLTPDKHGDIEIRGPFLNKIPQIDKGCWYDADGTLIIKGEIVQPKPVEVATKYEV